MKASEKVKLIREDATRPLTFEITEKHVKAAKCGDPSACVIAQAVTELCGDMFEKIEVGAKITKVYRIDNKVIRYVTSERLSKALIHWDKTQDWLLPPGKYRLLPPRGNNRAGIKKATGSKTNAPTGNKRKKTYNLPTRTVARCYAAKE